MDFNFVIHPKQTPTVVKLGGWCFEKKKRKV